MSSLSEESHLAGQVKKEQPVLAILGNPPYSGQSANTNEWKKRLLKWTEHEMWTTILNFSRLEPELARKAYDLGKDARDWKVALAQKDIKESGPDKSKICQSPNSKY